MLFSNRTEEEKRLNDIYSTKTRKSRGKIDKIHKHFQYSLKQLEKIDDKHTLFICIHALHDYHINWTEHCLFDEIVKDKFLKVLEREKNEFIQLKRMGDVSR